MLTDYIHTLYIINIYILIYLYYYVYYPSVRTRAVVLCVFYEEFKSTLQILLFASVLSVLVPFQSLITFFLFTFFAFHQRERVRRTQVHPKVCVTNAPCKSAQCYTKSFLTSSLSTLARRGHAQRDQRKILHRTRRVRAAHWGWYEKVS